MSPKPARPSRKLALNRDTLRSLENQAVVKFGPQTSERRACCGETVDVNGNPVTLL
jgi:hypothetical protein